MTLVFLDNTLLNWSIALSVTVAASVLMYAGNIFVVRRWSVIAGLTRTPVDDVAVAMLASTHIVFVMIVAVYIGTYFLDLPHQKQLAVSRITVVALLLQLAYWGDNGIRHWLASYRRRKITEDAASTTSTAALGFIVRMTLWLIIVLVILDNLGFNITALVASLGISGIAVALAVQNILGDIFASLSIVLDKPFVVGDFIIVDDVMGTVEFVGLKTTRVRSIGGEQVVFSNGDLLKSRIRNHKRMQTRRAVFTIGVSYQTTEAQLRAIPQIVRELVTAQPGVSFDRAHFKDYGESSLNFEVVYNLPNPDFNFYMDVQQVINLGLFQRFAQEGIEFAYRSHTLQLLRQPGRQVSSEQLDTRYSASSFRAERAKN